MQSTIDLRSDTVTRPSPAMRRAIAEAVVGDDVWGEDPTVLELQRRVAALLGKEAALFVPSGTMANQIALLVHTRPGSEVLLGQGCHCQSYEGGAGAALAGVQFRCLGADGLYTADQMIEALHPDDLHLAPTALVWLENTHNRSGGRIFPQHEVEAISCAARARGLPVHLDGARLLNAAVATGRPPRELAEPVDSLSICLSKGLGAPIGSVLAGGKSFISQAMRYRKMLGGGMRQVGVLAAAGIYALEHNMDRLADDHRNAQVLARALEGLPRITFEPSHVETNIVIFDLEPPLDATSLLARCTAQGLLLSRMAPRRVRAVTHLDVGTEECEAAAQILRTILS